MKKLILLICVLCSTNLIAQNNYAPKKSLEERASKFNKEITDYVSNITPEQNTKLLEINKRVTQQFDSLKALQLESDFYRPAARNIFKNRDEDIRIVLNVKQYDEFMMQQAEKRDLSKKRKEAKLKEPQNIESKRKIERISENVVEPVAETPRDLPKK